MVTAAISIISTGCAWCGSGVCALAYATTPKAEMGLVPVQGLPRPSRGGLAMQHSVPPRMVSQARFSMESTRPDRIRIDAVSATAQTAMETTTKLSPTLIRLACRAVDGSPSRAAARGPWQTPKTCPPTWPQHHQMMEQRMEMMRMMMMDRLPASPAKQSTP